MRVHNFFIASLSCHFSRIVAHVGTPVVRAINPTSAGQIGVNPVTDEPASYYEDIEGVATNYYELDHSTTKWIGVNTEYLTDLVETTTVNNVPTTITTSIPLIAATATDAANGQEVGEVTIVMSPALTNILDELAAEAATICLESRKRQSCDVRHEFANLVNTNLQPGGSLVEFDFDFLVPTIAAEDVAAIVSGVTNALPILGVFVMSYLIYAESGAANIPPVINIPPSLTVAPTAVATASGCAYPTATGENRITCPDADCNGPNTDGSLTDAARLCTSGSHKNCQCVRTLEATGDNIDDQTWLDDQQTLLMDWINGDFSSNIPTCNNITSSAAWDNSNIVIDDGAKFCSGNSGSDVSKVSKQTYQDTWTYFDGTLATFSIGASLGSGCGSSTVSQSDCSAAIQSIMDDCPTGTTSDKQKYGGSIEVNCQVYTVTPIKYTPCISTC